MYDKEIVNALLCHDETVTREFFYRTCYPLFKSVYDNYYTDCSSCMEFINEMYLHIMEPHSDTGLCKLYSFKFQSTLFTWIKTVCLFYCYKRYDRKTKADFIQPMDDFATGSVRFDVAADSITMTEQQFCREDVETILSMMPNRRYSCLIRFKYLDGHTNEETAQLLGMNMNTFYNKHKLAKEQYVRTLRQCDTTNK